MSTLGREADRLAEQARKHQRRVAERAATVHECIRFCIATLKDKSIADDVARKTALEALRIGGSA